MSERSFSLRCLLWLMGSLSLSGFALPAADILDWRLKDRISADIRSMELKTLLEKISASTGWKIYVEPETLHTVSAKFRDLPPVEALHLLLGEVNFALLPQSGEPPKLLVFRTSMEGATQLVKPRPEASVHAHSKVIPNELIVRLKPGQKIEDLARLLGAKVIGKMDSLNAYRLQFDSAGAADAARSQLAENPEVASVESNYQVDRPPDPGLVKGAPPAGTPRLTLNPPTGDSRIIVGLVDTQVQQVSAELDKFILKQLYVGDSQSVDSATPLHGTAMAQAILQSLEGTLGKNSATSIQILPVDIYGNQTYSDTFKIGEGIKLAADGGAKIINMSFGSDSDSPFLRDVIAQGEAEGIKFIGAKGNEPVTTSFFPAADPGVFPVAALDNGVLADYSNRAPIPSLAAPGTAMVNYGNQTWYERGTSVSAAYISGIAAGYLDKGNKASGLQNFLFSNYGMPKAK